VKLLKKILSKILIFTSFICFIVLFVIFKNWDIDNANLNNPRIDLMNQVQTYDALNKIIQIEVLNGCGDKGVADLYANYLRNNNYDVIDYKNAENFDYNASKIIVHNNNLAVENVAELFQIDSKNVDYLFNENIFYDMTLIVGKDYKQLESFENVSKYYSPY
tara:strand:- start:3773 stop:4258 length:486 start_codon:yes stop_codon:yes gene_type:complete